MTQSHPQHERPNRRHFLIGAGALERDEPVHDEALREVAD
jgi:hypothetical protein